MERKPVLQRKLKLWHIVAMGVGYMAPMAVFDTFGIVSEVTAGHVPAAYLLTIAAVLFTAMSYGHMVKVYPSADCSSLPPILRKGCFPTCPC